MTTDSTELTFVRCPSCRSLVPAVSTRCRMCGATLDASQASDAGSDAKEKSGRVRQKTMSAPPNAVANFGAAAAESIPTAPTPVSASPAISEMDEDDPLSAYMEEVEVREEASFDDSTDDLLDDGDENDSEDSGEAEIFTAEEDDDSDFLKSLDSNDDDDEDDADYKFNETEAEEDDFHEEDDVPFAKRVETVPTIPETLKAVVDESPPFVGNGSQSKDEPPKVIIESGGRRTNKNGLSFGKNGKDAENSRSEAERAINDAKASANTSVNASMAKPEPIVVRAPEVKPVPAAQPKKSPITPRESTNGAKAVQAEAAGRLFGWLVSYLDPDGNAIEVREGKFFVTGRSLKSSDLVLEDASVSTPHAMVTISASTGFQIQDLMSERGIWVRSKGESQYRREAEICTVSHGDWLRFGDVEFLVSMVAYVGAK